MPSPTAVGGDAGRGLTRAVFSRAGTPLRQTPDARQQKRGTARMSASRMPFIEPTDHFRRCGDEGETKNLAPRCSLRDVRASVPQTEAASATEGSSAGMATPSRLCRLFHDLATPSRETASQISRSAKYAPCHDASSTQTPTVTRTENSLIPGRPNRVLAPFGRTTFSSPKR